MKKLLSVALCIIMIFSLESCALFCVSSIIATVDSVAIGGFIGNLKEDKTSSMFESFGKNMDCVLLTHFQLVIGDVHYNRSEFTYEGRECEIVFLEENGFYSYTHDYGSPDVVFLFTYYENFETVLLGRETFPERINYCIFSGRCFLMVPPYEFRNTYYSWNIDTHETSVIDENVNDIPQSKDKNRSNDYFFSLEDTFMRNKLVVTKKETGVSKTIARSVLNSFDEGKRIKRSNYIFRQDFCISSAFERDGDIYFVSFYEAGCLGFPSYYYVLKWNFETEDCSFCTYFFFDEYQEWIDDIYVF